MNIQGEVVPGARTLLRLVAARLSPAARARVRWMDFYEQHGRNARLTCRHFGLSPDVFYRWKRRYDPRRLESLEDDPRTRRPRQVRQPQTPLAVVERIRQLRERYPRWGKEKLVVLLRREGIQLSASSVGRVLTRLRARGVLREPRRGRRAGGGAARPYARRWPPGYAVGAPGDLVQVDTLDVAVDPKVRRKQFTARDVVSRYDVAEAYGHATARTAAAFLEVLLRRMPFPVRALQIDGGSEFRGAFEAACAGRRLPLFVVPPRSPKLQGHVERAQRTYREEFYQVEDVAPELAAHRQQLQTWVEIYNTIRPHQQLGYLTPWEYCQRHLQQRR